MKIWPWSEENLDELRMLIGQGLTDREAAAKSGRTLYAVQCRRKLLRLAPNCPKVLRRWTDDEYAHLLQLLDEGKTQKECAAILGRSTNAIQARRAKGTSPCIRDMVPLWSKNRLRRMYITDCRAMIKHHRSMVVEAIPDKTKELMVNRIRETKRMAAHIRKMKKQDLDALRPGTKIMEIIASNNGFSSADIMERGRQRKLVEVRHKIAYEIYKLGKHYSLPVIAEIMKRDHSTILHAIRQHARRNGLTQLVGDKT